MKTIYSMCGKPILVSDSDYARLNKCDWLVNSSGYAYTFVFGKRKTLHRLLMKPPKHLVVDHINRNRLDNRRENLRVVTHSENMKNKGPVTSQHRENISIGKHRKAIQAYMDSVNN